MNNLEETLSAPVGQKAEEKATVNFKHFCVVANEPEKFVEKLDQLCQDHCDSTGDYFFDFRFSD